MQQYYNNQSKKSEYIGVIINYSDVVTETIDINPGEGNINKDPIFVSGPNQNYSWGDYYRCKSGYNQPMSRWGKPNSAPRFRLSMDDDCTDGIFDTDRIDMGYHYSPHVQFEFGIDPERESFKAGDKIKITTDLITAPYRDNLLVDLYFVMNDPENNIYSYPTWEKVLQPSFLNLPLPGNLSQEEIVLLEMTLPMEKPPIRLHGEYTFAIVAVMAGMMEPISNLSAVSIEVE
ncbi:hypothetical protein KKB18_13590 [bacterium]|nr:hypothetical protein [bacterium]